MKQRLTRGFTIVELLIVIVVIAILAAITIVAFNGVQDRAHYSQAKQDLASIHKMLELYKVDHGEYPNSANCVDINNNYMLYWCGYNQGTGDSFIPGLVPKYAANIPNLNPDFPRDNTYLYQSSASTDGLTPGAKYYELIRFKADGLSNVERSTDNPLHWSNQGGYENLAWGYKSDPILPNW